MRALVRESMLGSGMPGAGHGLSHAPERFVLMLQADHAVDLHAAIVLQEVRVAPGDEVKDQVPVGEREVVDGSDGSPIARYRVSSGQNSW